MRPMMVLLVLTCTPGAAAAEPGSAWAEAAGAHGLDPLTLYAVALQESRTLWTDGTVRPWPWTLRSARTGAGRFRTREEAADALQALLAAGERNIDVGLMQVNVRYHGHRVADPRDLLDPVQNILTAAEILRESLENEDGDLARALGAYHHGAETDRGRAYSAEVRRRLARLRRIPGLAGSLARGTGEARGAPRP